MKITVWIRPDKDDENKIVMRVDNKWESKDTPVIQRYGKKLMRALEGDSDDSTVQVQTDWPDRAT